MAFFAPTWSVTVAQEIFYELDLVTYFDNREYGVASRSGTEFAERFTPQIGYRFDGKNRVNIGVNAYAPFAEHDGGLFERVELVLYYGFDSALWSVAAGIFPRERMRIDSYSTAFFTRDYLFSNSLVSGMMGRYFVGDSFVEFVCDWEGQPSEETRERFRLLSAARRYWSWFYVGYNFSQTHFAGQEAANMDNVVDNLLLNPRVGVRLGGKYEADVSVGYLQSMQRDRTYEGRWRMPAMVELSMSVSRWGVTLSNEFYLGDDLFPLYDGVEIDDGTRVEYGSLLYTGDPFFRSEGGFYDRVAVGYNRRFFDDKVSVGAQFVTHIDGSGVGTEQIVNVGVKLGGRICSTDKNREKDRK